MRLTLDTLIIVILLILAALTWLLAWARMTPTAQADRAARRRALRRALSAEEDR